MNTPVPFSRNIQAISIPDPATVDTIVFGKGIVAGWSGADIGQPAFEARAEAETVVDIMDKADCRDVYRGFALSGVASNTFCTKPANNTCVVGPTFHSSIITSKIVINPYLLTLA